MLEISGQDSLREVKRVDDDEAVVGSSPGDQIVRRWIVDHLISLHNKRCYDVARCLHPIYCDFCILCFFLFSSLFLLTDSETEWRGKRWTKYSFSYLQRLRYHRNI